MSKPNYISVGIDVGSSFNLMSIIDQYEQVILKPFRIIRNTPDSLARAVYAIKKAEEPNSMKSRTFQESTGIYHFLLFCHLKESVFEVFVINPLITHSVQNMGIRRVKMINLIPLELQSLV